MRVDLTLKERDRLYNLFMIGALSKKEYLELDDYSESRSELLTVNLN